MPVYDINRILVPEAPPEYEDHTALANYVPAPCQVACPIGTDAPSYIGYIWEGKFDEAFEAITATNPFSSICGRVCDAPCEPACRRTDSDGPLQIRNLKRFVMEKLGASWEPQPVAVTRSESIAIVGAGPAGLTAAQQLAEAGFSVHVYEMTDRLGGMMIWGIPAFRLPVGIIAEDIERLKKRCPGMHIHLNHALGREISLDSLKKEHDAVLLTIGAWWGKGMGIPGEEDERVVDGVGFLRRVNDGERPELPATVVVIGGGDVAMDACRVALRLPGCKNVKVIYRRGPDEIPARKVELEGAIEEGIEFIYQTQQVAVETGEGGFGLRCVKTEPGEPDEDGRCRPVVVAGSEHTIDCGMVIAAVGQQSECDDIAQHKLMASDRVRTDWDSMRTDDPRVFAAGDGAFGGSTLVMAMHHGQRVAYYIKAFLDGHENPLPYRTPYRTRQVPVAQDIKWEKFPPQYPQFFGVGKKPIEFPEIESTYDWETARAEASRCYRCDAETGSADYSVQHREDIFSMARTNPLDHTKLRTMLQKRMRMRQNPFPKQRAATLDDLVFLPANLSRLVIDPYREACNVASVLAGKLSLSHPFMVTGFDAAPNEVRAAVATGAREAGACYIGRQRPGDDIDWLQLIAANADTQPAAGAAGVIYMVAGSEPVTVSRAHASQAVGLGVSSTEHLETAIDQALDEQLDFLLIDGSGDICDNWAELKGAPRLEILRDTIAILRGLRREEEFDLIYFGGVRSGTDAAKLIGLGANVMVLGAAVGLAVGGVITPEGLQFGSGYTDEDRTTATVNIIKASVGEASMMARCTGKTNLHNVEPEDLRAVTIATAAASGIPMVGRQE
ncbi:MAG: FAD-dependent oxidoreductase [Gammaproteobacteria bacterium]|nr:FAD-dependent oxidoreductase [Gammaproteobacteria bacterium]